MGRNCLICGRERSNESFSGGRGARAMTCRKCKQLPRAYRLKVLALDEMDGFWNQSNISEKNMERLQELTRFQDAEVRHEASILLRVAAIAPRRKRRIPTIRQENPELYLLLIREGYVDDLLSFAERIELWESLPEECGPDTLFLHEEDRPAPEDQWPDQDCSGIDLYDIPF